VSPLTVKLPEPVAEQSPVWHPPPSAVSESVMVPPAVTACRKYWVPLALLACTKETVMLFPLVGSPTVWETHRGVAVAIGFV